MKTSHFLTALVALVGAAFVQPSLGAASVAKPVTMHISKDGTAYPALREALDSGSGAGLTSQKPYLIHLDTTEIDTGYIYFNVLGKPIVRSYSDTVGTMSFSVKDSTGTDTAAIRLYAYGNLRPDGRGTWFKVDSLDCKDLTTAELTGYKTCSKPILSTGNFALLAFRARNYLATSANRKSTIKDAVFITKRIDQ